MTRSPRLYEVLPSHGLFVARLRSVIESDDRKDLAAWLGVDAAPDRPLYAQMLAAGPVQGALRQRVAAECLRERFVAPNRLFDDRLRDEAGDDPAVKHLVDDPSLPFHLRAPGEIAGRAAGAARRAAAKALSEAEDLAAFVEILKEGEGEVVLAAL